MRQPPKFSKQEGSGLPQLLLPSDFCGGEYPAACLILGNQRLTAFADMNGRVSLLSGERGWARLNAAEPWPLADHGFEAAVNESGTLILSEPSTHSPTRTLGIGRITYTWELSEGLILRRKLLALPSSETRTGATGLLIIWEFENASDQPVDLHLSESVGTAYAPCCWRNPCYNFHRFPIEATAQEETDSVRCSFVPKPPSFVSLGETEDFSIIDSHPPAVFFSALQKEGAVQARQESEEKVRLSWSESLHCQPREKVSTAFVFGYAFSGEEEKATRKTLKGFWEMHETDPCAAQATLWRAQIPEWSETEAAACGLEMQWHAGALLQMAQYIDYFKEVRMPQGTVYDYIFGASACSRDHLQHIFPVPYFAPELAKSLLREICKRTDSLGHTIHTFEGAGSSPHGGDYKSDSEIYAFKSFAEYFRATGDASFLTDSVEFYPPQTSQCGTVLDRLGRMLRFLVDVVGVGPHGLVRLLCSDWNDNSYLYMKEHYYLSLVHGAESHLNTAMAICHMGELADALDQLDLDGLDDRVKNQLSRFITALRSYRKNLLEALQADWPEDKPFIRRFRALKDLRIGDDNMFIEPQSYALGIPELGERREALWQEIQKRLLDKEPLGPRQLEATYSDELEEAMGGNFGSRDNGGIWFALTGPMIEYLHPFAPENAQALLQTQTLTQHAQHFPEQWIGLWSGPDCYESAHSDRAGGVAGYLNPMPLYCAHAHAWPLYNFLRKRNRNQ